MDPGRHAGGGDGHEPLRPFFGHPYTYDSAASLTADYNIAYAYSPFGTLGGRDRFFRSD